MLFLALLCTAAVFIRRFWTAAFGPHTYDQLQRNVDTTVLITTLIMHNKLQGFEVQYLAVDSGFKADKREVGTATLANECCPRLFAKH